MRSYVIISGLLFALIVVVHVMRLAAEGFSVVENPAFSVSTLAAAAMSAWAWLALKVAKHSSPHSDA